MEKSIKPIETNYKGYRFRSRLEARWAVFFDAKTQVFYSQLLRKMQQSLQNYISRHSDWSRPDAICSLQELSVCQHWGNSCV